MNYDFWQNALAGKPVAIHENSPECGFYRMRRGKNTAWMPVAIWGEDDGTDLLAMCGEDLVDPHEIWTWCCRYPISHDLYRHIRKGGDWPEDATKEIEAARAEIGHNSGLPHEEIRDEIEAADRAFTAWLESIGGAVKDEEADAKAETFRTRIHELSKKGEALRVEEKAPHLSACREIDAKWKPIIEEADAGKRRVGSIVQPYRVKREAQRRAEEAERAAKVATGTVEASAVPGPGSYVTKPKKGFREVKVCVIDDPMKAAAAIFAASPNQPDLIEAITKVARRMLEAGVTVEGARLTTEPRV